MNLAIYQRALSRLLLSPDGLPAFESPETWAEYLREEASGFLRSQDYEPLLLYENLLFNSVEETLRLTFPHCKPLLGEDWEPLVEDYRRYYPNLTCRLYLVGARFPEFLAEQESVTEAFPFLPDLARYQWTESILSKAPNTPVEADFSDSYPDSEAMLRAFRPAWNPVSELLILTYDIPSLIPILNAFSEEVEAAETALTAPQWETLPESPGRFLIYREPDTHQIRFFKLNELIFKLITDPDPASSYYSRFEKLHQTMPALQRLNFQHVLDEGLVLLAYCFTHKIYAAVIPSDRRIIRLNELKRGNRSGCAAIF